MKRNYHWERIPVRIVSLEKGRGCMGELRIEAVLESRSSNEVEEPKRFNVNWVYGTSVKTSEKLYGNHMPECFEWAYDHAGVGQEVFLHHCLDDNSKYFYYC